MKGRPPSPATGTGVEKPPSMLIPARILPSAAIAAAVEDPPMEWPAIAMRLLSMRPAWRQAGSRAVRRSRR